MLKKIHTISCAAALSACQRLMQSLVLWLCDPATNRTLINQTNLQPPTFPSAIEANWLWDLLQRVESNTTLLSRAQTLADLQPFEKTALRDWVQVVSAPSLQFQPTPPTPPAWPVSLPGVPKAAWEAFQILMEAFYKQGLRSKNGVPYLPNGTPVATGGVNYERYVQAFRDAHRLNPDTNAREVCVLCGGPLGETPEVDHWILKSAFPLLSVCAENLLPICGECNSSSNKGKKPVHNSGSFVDWFHPYFRPANNVLSMMYTTGMDVKCTSTQPADQQKVKNLDELLNLSKRWTREFKAEYAKQQVTLRRRKKKLIAEGLAPQAQTLIRAHIEQWKDEDLLPSEPHYELHSLLSAALLEKARLAAWETELCLA